MPNKGESDRIKILGATENVVIECKNQINIILTSARNILPFTHFISIPVCSNEIKENFLKFKVRYFFKTEK